MKWSTQVIRKWTGSVLVALLSAAATIAPACAQQQSPPDPLPNAPGYERFGNDATASPDPSLPTFSPDLSFDDPSAALGKMTASDTGLSFSGPPNGPDRFSAASSSSSLIVVTPNPPPETKVQWRVAVQESLLFTGVMHTFNIWTQAGTRDTLLGPWLKDYLDSVGELRGWSDSDRFIAPYLGHSIEGSVFGYIQRQNDPRYRNVQWGDGRDYFMSLLHSLVYSAIWHTQWKIGPASEASIGNVMLHASPGFITLADTPTLGTVEMIGEDTVDRYLIMRLENRTANRPLIILARSFLNPGRSFANVMAFHLPWRRDTRLGLMAHQDLLLRKDLIAEYKNGGEKPLPIRPARPGRQTIASIQRQPPLNFRPFPSMNTSSAPTRIAWGAPAREPPASIRTSNSSAKSADAWS